ncbi:MFS transporter [Halobaculum sp. MBLA0143]|uniref:MFS transporter n=1 Tax=Halobaculum sp. MBLA0143 TaxID=3079933 RepID=UPI0035260BF0
MSLLRTNRNFLLLFSGRVLTNVGDSVYVIASMWFVHDLTGSTALTGLAGFIIRGPKFFRAFVGPLVDRWPLKRTITGTELVQACFVATLPLAYVQGLFSVWLLLGVTFVVNTVAQFGYPAHKKAIPRIVADDDIVEGNSLITSSTKGLNVVFNAASGVLVGVLGIAAIFALDFLTFLLSFTAFSLISLSDSRPETSGDEEATTYVDQLRRGFEYVVGSRLRTILLAAVVANFTYGLMYAVLPQFADSFSGLVLGGVGMYGLLMAAMSAGTLIGTASVQFVDHLPFGRLVIVTYSTAAVTWGLGIVSGLPLVTLASFVVSFSAVGVNNVMLLSVIQSTVEDRMLSRVSAITSTASTSMLPVGSLLGGALAEFVGVTPILLLQSVGLMFIAVVFLVRPQIRSLPSADSISPDELGLA